MRMNYYKNTLSTDLGEFELYVSDNMCNTFVYAEYLLNHLHDITCIDESRITRVLDVGCGAGPFCIYWGKLGKKVVGIDINPIAVECCKKNIDEYLLQDTVVSLCAGIDNYQSDSLYDLIVCNPPLGDDSYMRRNLSSECNRINGKLRNNNIDAEVEDFLTNCWKDSSGKDMIDHIFKRVGALLSPHGKIIIVCGDDFVEGDSFICDKASKDSLIKIRYRKKYSEHLKLEDSGEVFECDKKYNILVFEYIENT